MSDVDDFDRRDRKVSNFPANTVIPATTELSFVDSGVNYKIAKSDFITAMGATGTLVQQGEVTSAVPVLDIQGAVNNIRNIVSGSGVIASTSPLDGVLLDHNFTFDASGVPLTADSAITSPVIRSLLGGTGIDVTGAGAEITIAVSGATPPTTKTVVVSQLSDFPTPVGDVITLLGDTDYLLVNDVNIGNNTFVFGAGGIFRGVSNEVINLTATAGSGMLFTGLDVNATIKDITIIGTGMDFLDFTSTDGTHSVIVEQVNTVAGFNSWGSLDGIFVTRWENCYADTLVTGLLFKNSITVVLFSSNLVEGITAGTMFDFGTTVLDGGTIVNNYVVPGASSYFISGLADSANIIATGLFTVLNNRVPAGLGLNGVNEHDSRFQFLLNDSFEDTRVDAMVSLTANATETVIAIIDTPVQVAGTWVVENDTQFDATTGGVLTYEGVKSATLPIDISISLVMASGGDKQVSVYFAINGTVIDRTQQFTTASSSKAGAVSLHWQYDFAPGDIGTVWIENNSDTTNIIANGVFRIN